MATAISAIPCLGQSIHITGLGGHEPCLHGLTRRLLWDSARLVLAIHYAPTKSCCHWTHMMPRTQSVLLFQTRRKICTCSQTHRNTGKESRRTWARLSSVHTVLPPVLPTVLLGSKRFRMHHGATLAGSSSQFCSRVAEYYQRLLDQKTILESKPGPAISERLAVGDTVRAIVHHLRTLTLKTVEALVITLEFSFVALVLVVFFSESCDSRTNFCETTIGDSRIMSALRNLF
jgi:hypothetical protein